jgi:hypothetical protein
MRRDQEHGKAGHAVEEERRRRRRRRRRRIRARAQRRCASVPT